MIAYKGAAMHEILHIVLADYVPFIILICCGSFFLDAQMEFLYSPSRKKQGLIKYLSVK